MAGSELITTASFSPIASRYDATREVPKAQLGACYERLVQRGLLPGQGLILDAGCGTGQMSLVLAEMGYEIRGVDVSAEMVAIAQAKCGPGLQARYVVADVRSLPEHDASFDAIVVSKLFQHVGDWPAAGRELLRVLRPGACIIEVNDRGAFGNAVRKHFSSRADALGYSQRYIGLDPHDRAPFVEFFVARGCEAVAMEAADLTWEKRVSYGEALSQLRERLFAEFWSLPRDAHERILADTERWIDKQPEGRSKVEVMAPYLSVLAFRKPLQ